MCSHHFVSQWSYPWLTLLCVSTLSKGRKSQRTSKAAEASSQRAPFNKVVPLDVPKLKSQYGVDAWKRWIQWRQTQPNLEKPRFGCKFGYTVNTTTKADFKSPVTWPKFTSSNYLLWKWNVFIVVTVIFLCCLVCLCTDSLYKVWHCTSKTNM